MDFLENDLFGIFFLMGQLGSFLIFIFKTTILLGDTFLGKVPMDENLVFTDLISFKFMSVVAFSTH